MDALRHADAKVQHATHPAGAARWRMNRHNPMARLRWKKNRVTHPVGHKKAKTRARLNYINPLFYIRRIKHNLTGVGHRHRTTTVY
uniref:Uncharacterized protein n=1 Tax=Physcomitrium patens TaxID=3218 RepID=A0A2K1KTD1_PHYPA|nr:hypothetical protein PHYPA_004022 [Physcomitrium patens]